MNFINFIILIKEIITDNEKMAKFREVISDIKELISDIKDVMNAFKKDEQVN